MILEMPMRAPRIVPYRETYLASDVLPNGRPGPRVTQRYGDWDAYFDNRRHGAIDIGNFHCGDEILAMLPGSAIHIADPNGALGVRVVHGSGTVIEVWHLAGRALPYGTRVQADTVIGWLGASGINIGGCHAHIMYGPNGPGNYFTLAGWDDPWPLFRQNQREAVDMSDALAAKMRTVVPYRARWPAGVSLRTDTRVADDTFARETSGGEGHIVAQADGDEHPAGSGNRMWVVISLRGEGLRTMHSHFVTPIGTAGEV